MSQRVDFENILYAKQDGICTITLNRPERLNAIDGGPGSILQDMIDAVQQADEDPEIRCIVITGAGRAFSAGAFMLDGLPEGPMRWHRYLRSRHREKEILRDADKPVIGAINGVCYGAALMLVSNFDFLIAVDTARFGFIEMRTGDPGGEELAFLIGPQWAKFLALSGELITARKAREIGLVLEVFPEDVFMSKVYDLARRIAAIPPPAVAMQKRLVNCAMENMGWRNQKNVGVALNSLVAGNRQNHRTADGRSFTDLQEESWEAFKEARDAPFRPPWFDKSGN